MKIDLPDKLYFKIGEVADIADVAPHVLRYWESEFEKIKPRRAKSKQRLYRKSDVLLILEIKDLLHNKGFTISGAKRILANNDPVPVSQHSRATGELARKTSAKTDQKKLDKIKEELHSIRILLERKRS